MTKPLVALVGRPNVGKSTLFNRIIGERVAIVEDIAGTTRDRLYYDADWAGHQFTLVDTGGLEVEPGSGLAQQVKQQAQLAILEADVIVFLVDVREGIAAGHLEVAQILRQTNKPVVVGANKAETNSQTLNAAEFYQLGLDDIIPLSASHGLGTGELLDAVVAHFPPAPVEEVDESGILKIALVGRPNVGKSSLINAILRDERLVVTDIPGTTRDAIDSEIEVDGKKVILIDTAGMRRRGRIERGIEKYSVMRSIRAIERADVVALVVDASEGVTAQDSHLAGYATNAAKGLLFVVNKWDLSPREPSVRETFTDKLRSEMRFASYAPLVFTSAVRGTHVDDIVSLAFKIGEERKKRVPTALLNDQIAEALHAHSPPSDRGRSLKVYYATQVSVDPPTFVFFVNDDSLVHFSYYRYLENRLRQSFGFEGTGIRLVFRARAEERTA